jgi:hypothetical protein
MIGEFNHMSTSFGSLTTPDEYISYYYNLLKTELDKKDLQISKVGLIGYLLNIFGYTQFDVKQYYDYLFKEGFLSTADVDDNLILHGSIFRYFPANANPASIVGTFEFDFSKIPTKSSSVVKREIYITDLKINVGGLIYTLDSQYLIVNTSSNYMCQITDSDGKIFNIPFLYANPTISIRDLNQYSSEEVIFNSPNYSRGTYYAYSISIDENVYLADISVYVNNAEYEIKTIKWDSEATDQVVFVRQLSNKILIELGSGVHGNYIPNSEIKVIVKTTSGTQGNISIQEINPYYGNVIVYDTLDDDTVEGPLLADISTFVTVNVEYGENGADPLSGADLRSAILDYVYTRDNLISELDFDKVLGAVTSDNFVLFKKTDFIDNIIYNFVPFKNKQLIPIRSLSYSPSKTEFDDAGMYRPNFTINDATYISPFLYSWDSFLHVYKGYIISPIVRSYFSDISTENNIDEIPPSLSLTMTYLDSTDEVRFDVTSYEELTDYSAIISIPEVNVTDESMTKVDSNTFRYVYPSGVIYDEMDVSVDVYDTTSSVKMFTYLVEDVKIITDISDIFYLKTYGDTTSYVLNVPVIPIADFELDEDYYIQKFINLFGSIGLDNKTKMISDEVQLRFINADRISSTILEELTTSGLDFELVLPLKIQIDIHGSKSSVINNQVSVSSVKSQLELELAQFLVSNYTGTQISFYKTKIIDFVHNYGSWIKSVSVTITDSSTIPNEISGGNIETYNQSDILDQLSVFQRAVYCPVYFYWDINNITINVSLV